MQFAPAGAVGGKRPVYAEGMAFVSLSSRQTAAALLFVLGAPLSACGGKTATARGNDASLQAKPDAESADSATDQEASLDSDSRDAESDGTVAASDAFSDALSDAMESGADVGSDVTADAYTCTTCAACGRDCQGGMCTAGQCQSLVLASGLSGLHAIAVDEVNVYWTSSGGVEKCAVRGCNGNPTTLSTLVGSADSWGITVNA